MRRRVWGIAEESLVEASCYWDMCFYNVYWKGNQSIVKNKMAQLKLESEKLQALKEFIQMKGNTWLHKGVNRSVEELVTHLKMIIREEKTLMSSSNLAQEMPKRAELPILGIATQQLLESNDTAKIDEKQFREGVAELQKQREARGECGIFSLMQRE